MCCDLKECLQYFNIYKYRVAVEEFIVDAFFWMGLGIMAFVIIVEPIFRWIHQVSVTIEYYEFSIFPGFYKVFGPGVLQ
jgi:hypothetical protein